MGSDTPHDTGDDTGRPTGNGTEGHAARATFFVHGDVQGVGFRWWTRARALELGLVGHARNTADGRVEVVAQGPAAQVEHLERLLGEMPSTTRRPGHVTGVVTQRGEPKAGMTGFVER